MRGLPPRSRSPSLGTRAHHGELNARFGQSVEQVVPHRLDRGHLPTGRRVVVEGQAQGGLGEHLRRLAVAGVAAADLGDDLLATALADELEAEPRLRALLLARALALRDALEQLVA